MTDQLKVRLLHRFKRLRRQRPTFDQVVRFVAKRDERTVPDAISHVVSINDYDRARLERSMPRSARR